MKTIKLFALFILLSTLFAGCTPIEDYFVKDIPQQGHAFVNGPLTDIEYKNKVNRLIVPLMNEGEAYLSHRLSILRGDYPMKQELASVENSIDKVQKSIENLDSFYQPRNQTEHKMEALKRLNEYKDALIRYSKALESTKEENLKESLDYLNAVLASLKTAYGLY